MIRLRLAAVLLLAGSVTVARAIDVGAPDLSNPESPPMSPASAQALSNAFMTCLGAEGDVSPAEQQQLGTIMGGFSSSLIPGQGPCTNYWSQDSCATALAQLPCDQLSAQLGVPLAGLPQIATPPAWAVQYANAIEQKILQCYSAETDGGTPATSDMAALNAFGNQMAQVFTATASNGICTANETNLPACVASVNEFDCSTIGDALDQDDPQALAQLFTGCSGLIQCDASAVLADVNGTPPPAK